MEQLASLTKVPLRNIWPNEATNFTPWMANNITLLGKVIGLDLEIVEREASVGDFSLDLLATDLGTAKTVVIENQLTPTDHDHLGKLLTYAAGFNASIVILVAESFRDEHRQALEWLNQRTDTETQFFGIVAEVLKIDSSRPALNFKPVVFPNEWQKSKKPKSSGPDSPKGEKYRAYFQSLIDELREKHQFTNAKIGQPQNWYSFSSGNPGVSYGATFGLGDKAKTEVYIDRGDQEVNKLIFDRLKALEPSLSEKAGISLEWERMDNKRASRIAVYRQGSIEMSDSELEEIQEWHIQNLLGLRLALSEHIESTLKSINLT
jgi:hypothetical protein